ncbi:RagB/SusD family nutrient uptake outer membrane protein [Pedobacter steynii]|uniref:SusD family protein n=1 Tax=Pedobacter steynii TaxID=430522 RepID=A0A1D7QKX5_9SPHI|nr:RagB/SusD family nutrient uptake outer membrane protein [Pedobacter steynii]AOM79332.1 hypothetical protein BFS30_20470 [Pedobacter steynii]
MKNLIKNNIYYCLVLLTLCSCKKLIDVKGAGETLVTSSIFADSTTAHAALNGMYSELYNRSGLSIYAYRSSLLPAESADELIPVQNTFDDFYNNSLLATDNNIKDWWSNSYNIIYQANKIIEGANASESLSLSLKKQLTAESKFIRAFCSFYLVNYFGSIPLLTTSDLQVINTAPASTTSQVYTQIIADLSEARDALPKDYSWSGGNRTRVNSFVASAMLARVYLYTGQWALAEEEATKVINQTSLYDIVLNPNNVFLANSKEAIWQFYTNAYRCTYFALQLIPTGLAVPKYAVNSVLYNAFENGDTRKSNWINSLSVSGTFYTYPYKYKTNTKTNTEFEMVLRLAEQYLIRAEARTQQNNTDRAQDDLNVIRRRAGLLKTTASDKASLLLAIERERQVELCFEWGHRWLDLKRTNRANTVIGAQKPTSWQSTDVLYPIPQSAISTNRSLVQNEGYK